ncbi:hypothetical protein [Parasphingopyxis sp.]|uniref:hypothetical protein n=1 Tax=Parasphingopyxis sp. TaxID=1920299 RepID=UPI0026238EB2|nr:hypothetical protein [Parasphingopyxis sp.]
MKPTFLTTVAIAMLLPAPALADPVTRTYTVDTPRVEGERVVTRDRDAGSRSVDSTLIRKEDGAIATRNRNSQRTDTGRTFSGTTTRFNGDTRSYEAERVRDGNRYRTTGSGVGYNGNEYTYDARGRATPNGFNRQQRVRNADGEVVAGRNIRVRERGNTRVRRATVGNGDGARRTTTTRRTVNRRSRGGR